MGPQSKLFEKLEELTAHKWCNSLMSDPSVTQIMPRFIPEKRPGFSNSITTKTLLNDGAFRAYLLLFRPGNGRRRQPGEEVFMENLPDTQEWPPKNKVREERQRQVAKVEKIYNMDDRETPEMLLLVSIGGDLNGGTDRLHGGIVATLLDLSMGELVVCAFGFPCATLEMKIQYKAAITTPCVLLARAKLFREKGRWLETKVWIEDGNGKVFAEGSATFVMNKVADSKM